MYSFKTSGVCAKNITFDIIDNKVTNVQFQGGCPGNLLAISKLTEGRDAQELIDLLKGLNCGTKETSCPDQLSKALEELISSKK